MAEADGDRPRLLVLTPRFPYPVVGGDRLRIHAICANLAADYSLTLLSLVEREDKQWAYVADDGVFDRVETVALSRTRSRLQAALALPTATPLQIAYYRSGAFAARVRALLPSHRACLAHLIRVGDYVADVPTPPVVLEATDAISLNYERVAATRSAQLMGLVYQLERRRLRAYEQTLPARFAAVSFVSDADADYLYGRNRPANVVVAGNGVDVQALPFSDRANERKVAAFIGNMTTVQNLDACTYFVANVLPLIPDHALEEFRIVGRIGRDAAEALSRTPRVTVTGEVTSIPAAVAQAKVGICSMRMGAGVQNKILEYMALGLPVVTSSVGREGLGARPGEELLIADAPDVFAANVVALLDDPTLHRRLARAGRAYVEREHRWVPALRPLIERIRAVSPRQIGKTA